MDADCVAVQMRAARCLLSWTHEMLAAEAGVSTITVKRYETVATKLSDSVVGRLRAALEAGGIVLIAENGGGPGVRLRKASKQ
jgi:hypothetical protein